MIKFVAQIMFRAPFIKPQSGWNASRLNKRSRGLGIYYSAEAI